MATYEEYGSEGNEGCILRVTLPSSFIPDDYTLPGYKLQRLPVISSVISPSHPRAIIPELQVIASEIQVPDEQIHFSLKTSKELSEKMLSEVQHFQEMKEIFDHRKEEDVKFHKPALKSLFIEQDLRKDLPPVSQDLSFVQSIIPKYNHQSEIRKLKKTISQTQSEDGISFAYAHAKDDFYPRKVNGSSGRLKLIPVFQFPERVTNMGEITWKETRMVLSKDLSRDMLNHCALLIDHNDYLLNDWRNFADLPTEDQSIGVTGFDLVKNHLLNGSEGYNEGQGGPLAWINHADNNDLAKFHRPENHSRHNFSAVIALGKRPDRCPPIPKFLRQDSGYCTIEAPDIFGELSSEPCLQARSSSVDKSSTIVYVSHLNHLPWCDGNKTPGFHCDCPGPSREEGQELRENEEEDEEAFCRERRKELDLPEPGSEAKSKSKPGFKKHFSKPSFSNPTLKSLTGKFGRLGKSKDVSDHTSNTAMIECNV
ncbi:predicted protein [Sclerotinia sclerotiorum 1980 UF-70]|uniref:Uncharacterized protein n=1 Tax=Sclerotinia sclerotiorum (strain ATCC 18683 / 1980 / Ss-1) TaxID=665079 RepID=A7EKG0_SCLS1|nr:predicted protein [Sclerotinia sclerotiorum 1980 UF-70]EDO03326.1 predicted protein [Sclerotinia sclerotiorum 1980 UF-70]